MTGPGIRVHRRKSLRTPQHRAREDGRGGDDPQGGGGVLAVSQPRHQSAQGLDGRQGGQAVIQVVHLAPDFRPRPPEGGGQVDRKVRRETRPETGADALEGLHANQAVQGRAPDDEPSGLAVDIREHRPGGDDVFKSGFHGGLLFT